MTQREKLVRALEVRGWRRIDSLSGRFFKMVHNSIAERGPLWLGRSGALRVGRTSSNSTSVNEKWRQQLLEEDSS